MKKLDFGIYSINEMPELKLENIRSAYKGIPNRCMCGCSGRYFYTKINQKESSENRGYEVSDKEVNDKKVLEILKIMSEDTNKKVEVIDNINKNNSMLNYYIFTKVINDKQYTIYTN